MDANRSGTVRQAAQAVASRTTNPTSSDNAETASVVTGLTDTITKEKTMTTTQTGYVACSASDGDTLDDVQHGDIRATSEQASSDRTAYMGDVRYVHTDGYLYVDRPEE
jgi:hypothetical protein